MMIKPDFPFQKWTHVVIAVDGTNIDVYIDGKFVKSTNKFTNVPGTSDLTVGNVYTQGKIAGFRRVESPINPQSVWANYMKGNGQGMSLTPYHVNVQVLKNEKKIRENRIF
jgi:archaellum component FlaG (FlaF/FlaG flagellin family)